MAGDEPEIHEENAGEMSEAEEERGIREWVEWSWSITGNFGSSEDPALAERADCIDHDISFEKGPIENQTSQVSMVEEHVIEDKGLTSRHRHQQHLSKRHQVGVWLRESRLVFHEFNFLRVAGWSPSRTLVFLQPYHHCHRHRHRHFLNRR